MHRLGVEGVYLLTPAANTLLSLVFLTGPALRNFSEVVDNHMLTLTGQIHGRFGHGFAAYFITISSNDDL